MFGVCHQAPHACALAICRQLATRAREGAYLGKLQHPPFLVTCSYELVQHHRNHSETEICDRVVASSPDWFCPNEK